jgi:transcription elongation factor Elf1
MILAFECPYCMTNNSIEIDPLQDIDQQMIQDCEICCQPIELLVKQSQADEYQPMMNPRIYVEAKQDGE